MTAIFSELIVIISVFTAGSTALEAQDAPPVSALAAALTGQNRNVVTAVRSPRQLLDLRVSIDGTQVNGLIEMSPVERITEAVSHQVMQAGSQVVNQYVPGGNEVMPVTLTRAADPGDKLLRNWAKLVDGSPQGSPYKDVSVETLSSSGAVIQKWNLLRCMPTSFIPVQGYPLSGGNLPVETITFRCSTLEPAP